ncbi:MAG: AcrB/AcrD/AcrF family protein [Bacteroidetes bacterium]|jgi:CzcA family heavy metal efflux pump|nr:AcrB/AcrD/AcrF family protein [Bacteroidota bacterium]
MTFSWAQFSIDNRYTVFAAALAVVIFGALAWVRLPIALFPETAPPLVNIITPHGGAAALDVARDVSEPIEEEVATLDGLTEVTSTSQDGLSVVTAEFAYGRNVDLVAVDVQNAISRIREQLPATIGEPRVLTFSTSDKPVITLAARPASAQTALADVRQRADDDLHPVLQRIPGVAAVDVFGGARPQVNVHIDRSRLEAAGLTLGAVMETLRAGNVTAPAGRIERTQQETLLRFDETVTTVDDVERRPIAEREGQRILLGDIAQIRKGAADRRSAYRANGRDAVALQIIQQDDANTVDVVSRVQDRVPELQAAFPSLTIEVADEEASFTRLVVNNMGTSILSALLLASLVIFLFIGSLRGALIVSISMPMSFLLTLALMWMMDMELNLVTLSAVILAVGIVVDAAVVVLENIARHRTEEGRSVRESAVAGTNEVFFAVLVGIMTTLIVLVPFLFLTGFVGMVFGPLSTTLIFAFTASLLAAVTLIPLLATLILDTEPDQEGTFTRRLTQGFDRAMGSLRSGYLALLRRALRHRGITLGLTAVLLVASVALLAARGQEVLPRLDSGSFYISLETEPGTSFEATTRTVRRIEGLLAKHPYAINYTARVGFEPDALALGDAGAMSVQQAFMTVDLVSRKARDASIWAIQDRLRDQIAGIPGIRRAVLKEMGGTAKSTTSAPINVRFSGPDLATLDRLAATAQDRMQSVSGAVNVYRQWTLDRPEQRLRVDHLRAAQYGLTTQRLAAETFAAVEGQPTITLDAPDGTTWPVVVRYADGDRTSLDDMLSVRVRPGLPLRDVTTTTPARAPNLITRADLTRTADVLGFHYGRPFSHVIGDIEGALAAMDLPEGYSMDVVGENEDLQETAGQMIASLLIALIAVYLLLVAQFRSFVNPLVVMLSIPLVLVGVSTALVLAGKVISMSVLLGLILLVGIVVNNAILLVDFILEHRQQGAARTQAVVEAVRVRFRPIMMTSFSTIMGMLPLAMEWALGAERFSPMAVAVIGGLAASSLLTLVIIPVFYTVIDDLTVRARAFISPS